jgi:hypothetical protein
MKNTELQQIQVFKNETHRFVHVGIYNMTDKEGRPNYSATLDSLHRDASRVASMEETRNSIGAELAFGGSFLVRMMNTAREEWSVDRKFTNLSVFEAEDLAEDLREFYEAEGYSVTGLQGSKAVRRTGMNGKSVNNIKIKNANLKRIYQIVDKLTEGMTGIDIAKARRDIYSRYISKTETNFDTRRKFWHHIMKNWDNYAN